MKNSLNLTKVVYRDGVKSTGDKMRMTLCVSHSRMSGGIAWRVQFQSHKPYTVAIPEQ